MEENKTSLAIGEGGAAAAGDGAGAKAAASEEKEEISLLDIFAILWRYKWMIIIICAVTMIYVVTYSIISKVLPPDRSPNPDYYTPTAAMLIKETSSGGSSLSSAISSSGLGGLASLAGINLSAGTTNSSFAQYLVSSNPLLDAITDHFGLIEKYQIEEAPRSSTRKLLKGKLSCNIDSESGVFTVSFTDVDAAFGRDVVNFVVDWIDARFMELGLDNSRIQRENLEKNIQASYSEILRLEKELQDVSASVNFGGMAASLPSVTADISRIQLDLTAQQQVYTQLKTEYELLRVQMQSEAPLFQILERPEIPDIKSGPSRGRDCIVKTVLAAVISVLLAFVLNALDSIRNDPEALSKLKSPKKEKKRRRRGEA